MGDLVITLKKTTLLNSTCHLTSVINGQFVSLNVNQHISLMHAFMEKL